jgi:hypothetical protein
MRCESLVRLIIVVRSQPDRCAFPLGFQNALVAHIFPRSCRTVSCARGCRGHAQRAAARPDYRYGAVASGMAWMLPMSFRLSERLSQGLFRSDVRRTPSNRPS